MKYLIVVAHPDDEVLGVGATIHKLAKKGHTVSVCILSGNVSVRKKRPDIKKLQMNMIHSAKLLGIRKIIYSDFPNIKFNTVPHLEMVQFIEKAFVETKADVVITHHPSDLNNDHYHTSIACQAAIRLFQRNEQVKPVKELLYMEVPSSTEWGLNNSIKQFTPNTFVEVGYDGIQKKLEALSYYAGVMRPYPHPRSSQMIEGLAALRGSQSGFVYAESLESVFRRESSWC